MVWVFWEGDTQTELEVQGFSGVRLVEGQRGRCGQGDHPHKGGRGPQAVVQLWESLDWPVAAQGQGCSEELALGGGGKPCSLPSSVIAGAAGEVCGLGSKAEANPVGTVCRPTLGWPCPSTTAPKYGPSPGPCTRGTHRHWTQPQATGGTRGTGSQFRDWHHDSGWRDSLSRLWKLLCFQGASVIHTPLTSPPRPTDTLLGPFPHLIWHRPWGCHRGLGFHGGQPLAAVWGRGHTEARGGHVLVGSSSS